MRLILIKDIGTSGSELARAALTSKPLAGVVLAGLCGDLTIDAQATRSTRLSRLVWTGPNLIAMPKAWPQNVSGEHSFDVLDYHDEIPLSDQLARRQRGREWFAVSNGMRVARISARPLEQILCRTDADVLAVRAAPDLLGYRERLRVGSSGQIAGFRRLHTDSCELDVLSDDWPDHLFIRQSALETICPHGALPADFAVVRQRCRDGRLTVQAVRIAGTVHNVCTQEGLLGLCRDYIDEPMKRPGRPRAVREQDDPPNVGRGIRVTGTVLVGQNVDIGDDAVLIGPTIICDGARIASGATVCSAVIGPNGSVAHGEFLNSRVVAMPGLAPDGRQDDAPPAIVTRSRQERAFRTWPILSYAGCLKRPVDIVTALIVLILFAPIMPFIALAIKLSSPGPVFYRDKRQGLHGKSFHCIKFRTMTVGAHAIQDKLRLVSEVDGPQFKMADDPRINAVGHFLRETYLDEIPQFFNVLVGQMSVVGPRPSPESENTLCPFWRDARWSVRPGVSGLWQVYRTREPMKDFQEWIYYDTRYVRGLSLRTDLSVCRMTFKKMMDNFLSQF